MHRIHARMCIYVKQTYKHKRRSITQFEMLRSHKHRTTPFGITWGGWSSPVSFCSFSGPPFLLIIAKANLSSNTESRMTVPTIWSRAAGCFFLRNRVRGFGGCRIEQTIVMGSRLLGTNFGCISATNSIPALQADNRIKSIQGWLKAANNFTKHTV